MSKKVTRIICLVLAVMMVLGLFSYVLTTSVHAVTQADIDELETERSAIRNAAADVQEQIDALTAERASVMERKAALDQQIGLNRQDVELIDIQIALYDQLIEEKSEEVEAAQAAEQAQFERYCSRVRTMEETNGWTYFAVLLQAKDLTDFLSRLNDIMDIVRNDQNVKAQYEAARLYVEAARTELQQIQARQLEKREQLGEQEEYLEEQIALANGLVTKLEEDIDAAETVLDRKEAEEAEIQARIDKLVAEMKAEEERKAREAYEAALREQQRKAAAAAAAAQAAGTKTTTTTTSTTQSYTTTASAGYYSWPVANTYITSLHGYRVHPIFGTTKYHAGVDIGAGYNAAICAAAGGTVQIAEYSDSYGYYCVIYHSNGTTTLYAHMNSKPLVTAGSTVYAGQQIGYVGSTGWANGPHLHFEIRVNGATVDPLAYFPGIAFTYSPTA